MDSSACTMQWSSHPHVYSYREQEIENHIAKDFQYSLPSLWHYFIPSNQSRCIFAAAINCPVSDTCLRDTHRCLTVNSVLSLC